MKRTILSFTILLLTFFSTVSAQNDVPVSVCVGEQRLADLLTEEQKNSVTHLTITGTMAEEDYACLRMMFDKNLFELNLLNANIDTIPAYAFYKEEQTPSKRIILPYTLRHLADKSLCFNVEMDEKLNLVLSGKYPTLGKNVFFDKGSFRGHCIIELSPDNEYCKEINDNIYSADGTIFYHHNFKEGAYWINGMELDDFSIEIENGTKIINGGAFEFFWNERTLPIVIPETVDSIGDYAFNRYSTNVITGYWPVKAWPRLYCMAKIPPVLGKGVFEDKQDMWRLIVPDESLEAYKAAKGWNEFKYINPLSNPDGIKEIKSEKGVALSDGGEHYRISCNKVVEHVELYGVEGKTLMSFKVNDNDFDIDKSDIVAPYVMLRVRYKDGTNETVKLKP